MASTDFPDNEREEGDTPVADETTPAQKAADSQPSIEDYSGAESNGLSWAYNHKLLADSAEYDNRAMNLNQKTIADAQAQAVFWQNIQERQLSLKLASQELLERQQQFWQTTRERQDQHADQRKHAATLDNIEYSRARNGVQNDNETAMKHDIMAARVIEPTREEVAQDQLIGGINQAVETVSRAMVDRTQTSAANVSELSAARQVADVNVLNTLSELAGIVQTMQTQSATSQAAFMALTNQVSELVGAVQALQK